MVSKLWRGLLIFTLWKRTGYIPCPSSYNKQFHEEVLYKMLLKLDHA